MGSAVVAAALIALLVLLRRRSRRASNEKITRTPSVPSTHDDDNLESNTDQRPEVIPPSYTNAALVVSNDDDMPAGADGVGGDIVSPSASASLDGPVPSSADSFEEAAASDIGLAQAVLVAAQELAQQCQIPGVCEAATAVCMMAKLMTDSRDNARTSGTRLRQCNTIVIALKRAARVAKDVSWTCLFVGRSCRENV